MAEKTVAQPIIGAAALPGDAGETRAFKIGTRIARSVFVKRGDHSEAHLKEAELAALLIFAIEVAERERAAGR